MSCQGTPRFGDFHNAQQPSCDRAERELTAPGRAGVGQGAAGPTPPTTDGPLQPSCGLAPASNLFLIWASNWVQN